MKTALVQLNIVWESKTTNLARAEMFIQKAAEESCDLVVFPEMFTAGCSMNVSLIAENEGGETDMFLSHMAKKYAVNLIAGFPLKACVTEKAKNTAAVYDTQGSLACRFTKLHPFSFSREDHYYVPGAAPVVFTLEGMQAGLFICYDLRFPEDFRSIAREVQAVFILANWPASRIEHWETLLRARAIENQCFVIGVNRTGTDGNGLYFSGASLVFDPFGNYICRGGEKEEYLVCEFDPLETARIRKQFPFLNDMRQGN